MSGFSDSLVRHRLHAPLPAHPDDLAATPQTAPAAAPRTGPGGNMSAFGPRLEGTPPGGASECVRGHGTALDPAVGGPRPEASALCALGSSTGGGTGPEGVSSPATQIAAPAGVEFPDAVCGLGYPGSASAAAHDAQVPAADGGQVPAHQVLSAPHVCLEPTRMPPPRPLRKYAGPTRECVSRAGGPRTTPTAPWGGGAHLEKCRCARFSALSTAHGAGPTPGGGAGQ